MRRGSILQDRRDTNVLLAALSCLLFGYVATRAWMLSITWDEAANYLEFTRKGFLSPFYFPFPHFGPNNHFLNTWLTFLTTRLFGPGEFSLRLPVLAAHLLFLYYTARLAGEGTSALVRVASFIVLNVNPYLLDFFSLSRGYGLAYGLLAGSVWYLYRYFQSNLQARYGRLSITLAMLAVTAHLTMVHYLIALLGVLVLATILRAPPGLTIGRRVLHGLRVNAGAITAVTAFLLPLLVVIRRLSKAGAFFYGGTSGFWRDTVLGVFERSLYQGQPSVVGFSPAGPWSGVCWLLGSLAVLVVGIALVVSVPRLRAHGEPARLYLPALVFLLLSCSLASIVQHQLLHVLYLTGRTALYLLVLFTFVFVALANELTLAARGWQYGLAAVGLLMSAHAIAHLNLRYVFEWKVAADMKEVVEDIAAARAPTLPIKFNTDVGVNLDFETPLNYYRVVRRLTWLNVADRRATFHPLNDMYLYSDAEWRAVNPDSFLVVKRYPVSGGRLVRRRGTPPEYHVRFTRTLERDTPVSGRMPNGSDSGQTDHGPRSEVTDEAQPTSSGIDYRIDVPTLPAHTAIVSVRAMVWMKSVRNANAELAIVFRDQRGTYSWHGVSVQDFADRAETWFPVYLSCFVPSQARKGDMLSVYLANRKSPVYMRDLEMRWITAAP
jgi:hypothetical protein